MRHNPDYLRPYLHAVQQHGDGFGALLWASPQSQAARFLAMVRLCDFSGRRVLDAGCGRADLLDFLAERHESPRHYIGLEALAGLAAVARSKGHPNCRIIEADFVCEPSRLFASAEIIVFCGSLNTLSAPQFEATLAHACRAATQAVVFNFLSGRRLAGADWLTWHAPDRIRRLARELDAEVTLLDDYLEGDCTALLRPRRMNAAEIPSLKASGRRSDGELPGRPGGGPPR